MVAAIRPVRKESCLSGKDVFHPNGGGEVGPQTDLPLPLKRDFASDGGVISEEKRGPGEAA